jgi:hypothetical protein
MIVAERDESGGVNSCTDTFGFSDTAYVATIDEKVDDILRARCVNSTHSRRS